MHGTIEEPVQNPSPRNPRFASSGETVTEIRFRLAPGLFPSKMENEPAILSQMEVDIEESECHPIGCRLALVLPSLSHGGAQRVAVAMANHWASAGNQVSLITLSGCDEDCVRVSPAVRRVALGLAGESTHLASALRSNLRRVARLRRAIATAKAGLVISFLEKTNVLVLLATRGMNVSVVVAERTDPRRHQVGRSWEWLRRVTYPWCTAAVVQTGAVRNAVATLTRGRPVFVIPNPVAAPAERLVHRGSQRATGRKRVVGVGRLAREKGFDQLVEAFGRIAPEFGDWELWILGDGPERAALEAQATRVAPGRIHFHGWVNDPYRELSCCDLFVLPSRYEGFPNALLEAMACGLPVVSFACDSGPAEIVRQEVDGLLVPPGDVPVLAAAMARVMRDEELRRHFAGRAREVVTRFSHAQFFSLWSEVVAFSLGDKSGARDTPAGSGNPENQGDQA
jgi:glycosyltransferase involved in cell wall biosynthesis